MRFDLPMALGLQLIQKSTPSSRDISARPSSIERWIVLTGLET